MAADFDETNYPSENKRQGRPVIGFDVFVDCVTATKDRSSDYYIAVREWRQRRASVRATSQTHYFILATSPVVSSLLVCMQCNVLYCSARKFIHSHLLGMERSFAAS
jgi:hypothetical protein